jgi:hypothetical protein
VGAEAGADVAEAGAEAAAPERKAYRCNGCGASVLVAEGERTATCAFCGSPYVRAGETSAERFAPEFVLPFSVTRARAEEAYRSWLRRGGWFRPGDLPRKGTIEGLRGVYIPFWSFTMRSDSEWAARIGEHWYQTVHETYTTRVNGRSVTRTRTRRVQHTEWYPLSGRFHQFHSTYLVSASKGLGQGAADRVGPFPVSEATRYAPHFLAGWLCEEYTLAREDAARVSEAEFRRREAQAISDFLPGDTHDDLQTATEFGDVGVDLMLLPLWIFAYAYGGRTFRFVLNGATGRYAGDKPVSGKRVALAVAAVLAFLLALVALFLAAGRR